MACTDKPLVLVSGASGFVATHVIKVLLENGYRVRGTVRSLKNPEKVNPLYNLADGKKDNLQLVEADLLKPETWRDAVKGCTYVMHTASPFPSDAPKDPDEIIKPAVEGTLTVLKAAADVGGVKRIVLTSSMAAIIGCESKNGVYDESLWTDTTNPNLPTYVKSKALAEKAAWDFVEKNNKPFELAVINPSLVMGPLLHDAECTSAGMMKKLYNQDVTENLEKYFMIFVDVRDVAQAHLKAMTLPQAAGRRYATVNVTTSFKEVESYLDAEFGKKRRDESVPRDGVNPFANYTRELKVDNSRMINELGIKPIELKKTILDMAHSLIERGQLKKCQK